MTKVQRGRDAGNNTTITEKASLIVAKVFERSRVRRELGIPEGLADAVRRAKLDADEARYARETLTPLRAKARRHTLALHRSLTALVEAEQRTPRCRALEALGVPKDQPARTARAVTAEQQTAAIKAALGLGEPDFVLKLLRYLTVNLDEPMSRARRGRGRPRDQARATVEGLLRDAGLTSDQTVALALRNEGLEGAGDARDRVRQRRKRASRNGGQKPGR